MKRMITASTKSWPTKDVWENIEDDYEFQDLYDDYLGDPEAEVDDELQIFTEPSGQAGMGDIYITDDSGEERFEEVVIDLNEFEDKEIELAAASSSADEYKEKFRAWMKEVCGL